jgi:membrane protease YdiL (CAAX protease family)
MFCPECGGEYREGFTHCAHCDVDLVEELPRILERDAGAKDEGPFEATRCAGCGAALPEGEECERCNAVLDHPAPRAVPAAAAETMPGSRRLRLFELALVVGVGFMQSTITALYVWWVAEAPSSGGGVFSNVSHIVSSTLAIALLAYVLFRRGQSLKSIGLVFRRTDILWGLAILVFDKLMASAVSRAVSGFATPKGYPVGDSGLLRWLSVIPGAAKEELIVRAFLMTEVAGLTGSWGIAVIASVGFQSLYHLYLGTPDALLTAGSFFVSAVYYANTRRITPVILAHSLHNFIYLTGN